MKLVLQIVAGILILGGEVFFLQGINVLPGSYMTGDPQWAINGGVMEETPFLLTIGNGTTCGGGFKLTPHAKVDDGLLDVTIVKPLGIPTLLWHLPKVFLGTIDKVTNYARLMRTSKLSVASVHPIPVHVDGEIFPGDGKDLEIEIVPGALTVIGNY